MRLIAHNMLKSNIKGVENGYPLTIDLESLEIKEREFDPELVVKLLTKIEYMVLKQAIDSLGLDPLPTLAVNDIQHLIENAENAFENEDSDDEMGQEEDMEDDDEAMMSNGDGDGETDMETNVNNDIETESHISSSTAVKISKAINTDKKIRRILQKLHHALLEIHITEGALICPETGRRFPIKNGIPNMLLHEDEV